MEPTYNTPELIVRPGHSRLRRAFWAVLAVLLVVVVVIGIALGGIYKLGWQNAFTESVATVLPLPAGNTNGHSISLKDYYGRVHLLKAEKIYEVNHVDIHREALRQLMDELLVKEYASVNHVTSDTGQIKSFIEARRKQTGTALDTKQLNNQAEGAVLLTQVNKDLAQGPTGLHLAIRDAPKQLQKLSSSPSTTGNRQSNTFFGSQVVQPVTPLAALPPAVQAAFKSKQPGQTISTPISTPVGYIVGKYIENDADGKPLVRVALIQPTFAEWLQSVNQQETVHGYLPQTK